MKIITQKPVYLNADGTEYGVELPPTTPSGIPSSPLPGLGGAGYTPPPTGGTATTAQKFQKALAFAKDSGLLSAAQQAIKNRTKKNKPNTTQQQLGGGGSNQVQQNTNPTNQPKKSNKTVFIVGGVIVAVAIIGFIIYKKRKK